MHTLTRALVVVAACVPLVGVAQETPKVDANSMLVVVRGCPKGRAIVPLAIGSLMDHQQFVGVWVSLAAVQAVLIVSAFNVRRVRRTSLAPA